MSKCRSRLPSENNWRDICRYSNFYEHFSKIVLKQFWNVEIKCRISKIAFQKITDVTFAGIQISMQCYHIWLAWKWSVKDDFDSGRLCNIDLSIINKCESDIWRWNAPWPLHFCLNLNQLAIYIRKRTITSVFLWKFSQVSISPRAKTYGNSRYLPKSA